MHKYKDKPQCILAEELRRTVSLRKREKSKLNIKLEKQSRFNKISGRSKHTQYAAEYQFYDKCQRIAKFSCLVDI